MQYDVIIIGAGPGGIFSAYELMKKRPDLKVGVFEGGKELAKRHCPIDGEKITSCIRCGSCSIMSGFGGAGAFSDGKYNITNDFGGTLYQYIGKKKAIELMEYVDSINCAHGGAGTRLYSTAGTELKKTCIQNRLKLLDASVRHLGTDINYVVLGNLYNEMKGHVDFHFNTLVERIEKTGAHTAAGRGTAEKGAGMKDSPETGTGTDDPVGTGVGTESPAETGSCENGRGTARYRIYFKGGTAEAPQCIVSVGRSGSKWMEKVCREMEIPTKSNRVDIGVRVELPAVVFSHLTDELYESKIVYRTQKYEDSVRTFCMNPNGIVVNENTNGIVTVNGHSFEDPSKKTENTNFALLVSKHFSEPFKDSNGYGESIARLSNMLGGGVIVQRFGDLERGRRSTEERMILLSDGIFPREIAIAVFTVPVPRAAATVMAIKSPGIAMNTSMILISTVSAQPPKYPATAPIIPPNTILMAVDSKATSSDILPPNRSLVNRSLPYWSVPMICCQEGNCRAFLRSMPA